MKSTTSKKASPRASLRWERTAHGHGANLKADACRCAELRQADEDPEGRRLAAGNRKGPRKPPGNRKGSRKLHQTALTALPDASGQALAHVRRGLSSSGALLLTSAELSADRPLNILEGRYKQHDNPGGDSVRVKTENHADQN